MVVGLVLIPLHALAATVKVSVTGLDAELKDNVLTRLELYQHRDSPRLTVYEIRRLHRKAEGDIRSAIAPFGFYDPEISAELKEVDGQFIASYDVKPGEPVLVNDVDLSITGPGSQKLMGGLQQFPLGVGDVLDQAKYEKAKKQLVRAAIRQGYMKAEFIVREIRINRKERRADISLTLDTGPQYVFGETIFYDENVDQSLLAKYLPYTDGEPYKPIKLINLQRSLYRSDYFSRVVVDGKVDQAVDNVVPVEVRLTEPEHLNRYSIGLGYATDTGVRGRFEWRNRLLNHKGHKFRFGAQLSELDNNIGLNYEVPWRNPITDKMLYNASYHDQIWDDTDTRLFTLGVQLEHRGEIVRHSGLFEVRDERYTVGATSGDSLLFVPTYTGTLVWADDLFDTRYGLELSLSVSGASKALGSDASFVKSVIGGKFIYPFVPGWRLITRGSLGATLVDSIDDLPPSLRFYAGGDNSIRGYGYKEIGTKDSSGTVVGGRYLVIGSIEVEKEVTPTWGVAAFWDVGTATDDLSLRFEQGVGVGLRYRLPFGQVRVDLASAILEDGAPLRLHLTVGADL